MKTKIHKRYTEAEAIAAAELVFGSPEGEAYNQAREAYNQVREACVQARGTCAALIPDSIIILAECRAFNLTASDREGVYCIVLTRHEVWWCDGKNCPDPETVEVVWKEEDEHENQNS